MNPRFAIALLLLLSMGVLCLSPARAADAMPPVPSDPQIAAYVGAVSAAELRSLDTTLVGFGTRNLFSERSSIPGRGVFAARDWIRAQFENAAKASGGRMTVTLDTYIQPKTPRTPRAVAVSSVIATLRGDDPTGPTYVMSSHYDNRNSDGNDATLDSPGADDNGSGTIAVIEAARIMAAGHFHGTIVFACFDGEEQGLFGSDHFAATLRKRGVNVAGNLNNDIMGASIGHAGERNPYIVRLFSEALPAAAKSRTVNLVGSENDSPSRELARFVKDAGERYVPAMQAELIYRSDRFLRGGDQQSFTAYGFPGVRFVEKHETYAHQHQNVRVENGIQYGDLLAYVDFDYTARVTAMNVAALAALALGPDAPGTAQMLAKTLGYDTTLRWKPAAHAVSYEILWRETTSPVWQYARAVGDVTTATVDVSKDDYILGVRSVDASGHRSVVSYPVAVKE